MKRGQEAKVHVYEAEKRRKIFSRGVAEQKLLQRNLDIFNEIKEELIKMTEICKN